MASVVRVAGVILPANKHINIALRHIYGIGPKRSRDICEKLGLELCTKVGSLTEADVDKLNVAVNDSYTVEGDLRREIGMNIKRLMDIKCYRGIRHRKGLPVRGQRTQTNAKTRKKGKGGKKGGQKGGQKGGKK